MVILHRIKNSKKIFIVIFGLLTITILLGGGYMLFDKSDNEKVSNEKVNNNDLSVEENPSENNGEGINEEVNNTLDKAPINATEFLKLNDGEYMTDKGYTLIIKDGLAYVEGQLIVNKTYSLSENYKPGNPYEKITSERCNNCLEQEVMKAFNLMKADASSLGLNIYISSGYRSYNYQQTLYNNYSAVSGQVGADTYSARPGHSEHQSGLCFDLNSVDATFAKTNEGIWIQNNAYLYGFVIRYPEGKENITGYIYESWHLRYVGKDLASKLYNNGNWLTIEEYYGLSSSY